MSFPNRPEALRCRRLQGLSYAALSGSRGSVARDPAQSSEADPYKTALRALDERPVARIRGELVASGRPALQPAAARVELAPPMARRFPEGLDEERGQVRLVSPRHLRHVLRGLVPPDDAGEVVLRLPRRVLAVRTPDDEPREPELRLHRVAARHRLLRGGTPP